ncbi:hypothetical protein D3C80_1745500 [compost metagenome]
MVEAGNRGDDADKGQQGVPFDLLQLILPGQFDAAAHQQPGVEGDQTQADADGEFDADLEQNVAQHRTDHGAETDDGQPRATGLEAGFRRVGQVDQILVVELAQIEEVQGGGEQQPADQGRRDQQ